MTYRLFSRLYTVAESARRPAPASFDRSKCVHRPALTFEYALLNNLQPFRLGTALHVFMLMSTMILQQSELELVEGSVLMDRSPLMPFECFGR